MLDDRLPSKRPVRLPRPVRIRRSRHRLAWGIAALAAVAILVGVIVTLVLRSGETVLAQKVEARLAAKLRADVSVGEIRPDLEGGVVRRLAIRGPGGLRVDADEVQVPLDLWGLASGLAGGDGGALRRVRLHGVTVVVDPRSKETRRWLRTVLGRRQGPADGDAGPGADGAAQQSGAEPAPSAADLEVTGLEITGLTVRLIDARGEPRDFLSEGALSIDRQPGSGDRPARTAVSGSALLAGGGRLALDGGDRGAGSEMAVRVSDLGTRWVAPLLPEGVAFRDTEETVLSGRIDLSRSGPGEPWAGRGSFEADGVTLASDELADGPVRFPRLRLAVDRITATGTHEIELADGVIQLGSGEDGAGDGGASDAGRSDSSSIEADVDLRYEDRPDGARYRLRAEVPESACRGLVAAVPDSLLGDLDTMELDGTFSAGARLDLDLADLDATVLDLSFSDHCRFLRMPLRLRAETLRRPFTLEVPAAEEGRMLELTTGPGAPGWVPLERVSRFVRQAVLAHEDATFYRHEGFAPIAIRNSLVEDLEQGRFVRGASTISMQLAKNLYLSRDKVLARKVREAFLTWWLERSLSKDEIFALYLNVIEYGPDLYGIGAASSRYFDAPPDRLGPADAAFLATALPAPKAYYHNFERGSLSSSTEAQMRFLLEHMFHKERIDRDALDWGLGALDDFRFGRVQPRPHPWIRWLRGGEEGSG